MVALDDALNSLAEIDERKSQIVEMRFFGGLSIEETAEVLGVSPGTVMRDWTLAKAWLRREIDKELQMETEQMNARNGNGSMICSTRRWSESLVSEPPFWPRLAREMKVCAAKSKRCSRRTNASDNFIGAPALDVAAGLLAQQMIPSLEGRRLGHYQVLSLIGAGGMGQVFLADDTRLKRQVAIKVLPAPSPRIRTAFAASSRKHTPPHRSITRTSSPFTRSGK